MVGTESHCPVAVIIRDNAILLGHRHYTADKWQDISVWTVPGGRCDEDENIETTLRREVAEEIGVTDLLIEDYLGTFPGAKAGDEVLLFRCSSTQVVKNMEPHKFSNWQWFTKETFPNTFINQHVVERLKSLL